MRRSRPVSPSPSLPDHKELLGVLQSTVISQPDEGMQRVLEATRQLTGADDAFALLARRCESAEARHLHGWRPMKVFHLKEPNALVSGLIKVWMSNLRFVARDRATLHLAKTAGQPRAFLRSHVLGNTSWWGTPTGELLEQGNRKDRMTGGAPLSSDLEFFVGVDRGKLRTPFDTASCNTLVGALELMTPFARTVALSWGLAGSQVPPTSRERAVLLRCLAGREKKEIAAELGISVHTVSDHLKVLFRKFGVSGRHELMGIWLNEFPDSAPVQ